MNVNNAKWLKILLICTLIVTGTVACGGKKDDKATAQKEQGEKKEAKAQADQPNLKKAHYLEEEVETLQEVNHANVLLRERDAFVSIDTKLEDIDEEMKNKIVSIIRTTDPDIGNIYISHNQDFNARMSQLSRDIERGTPRKEIGESFERTIKRVFPELGTKR